MSASSSGPEPEPGAPVCEVEMNRLEAQLAAALVLMTAHLRCGSCSEQRLALARKVGAQLQALAAEHRLSTAFRRVTDCLASQWADHADASTPRRSLVLPAAAGLH